MRAGLAQFDGEALDVSHPEAFPDQLVQIDAANRQLPPRFAGGELGLLHGLGRYEGQRLPGGGSLFVEVAVSDEPLPGDCEYRVDRPELTCALRAEMNGFHRHEPIMHQPALLHCGSRVLASQPLGRARSSG